MTSKLNIIDDETELLNCLIDNDYGLDDGRKYLDKYVAKAKLEAKIETWQLFKSNSAKGWWQEYAQIEIEKYQSELDKLNRKD